MSKDTNKNVDVDLVTGGDETPAETAQPKAATAKKSNASAEILVANTEKTCRVRVLKSCKPNIGGVTYKLVEGDNISLPEGVATLLSFSQRVTKL